MNCRIFPTGHLHNVIRKDRVGLLFGNYAFSSYVSRRMERGCFN